MWLSRLTRGEGRRKRSRTKPARDENKMVVKTFKSVAYSAYKKKLEKPLKYSGDYKAYESIEEVRAANDFPSDKEIVRLKNAAQLAKAKAAAKTAGLDAIGVVKSTIENDKQMALREFVKVLMSSKKYTLEAARALAAQHLGYEWEDGEDEDEDDEE